MYMANMSWNSSMNIPAVLRHLTATDETTGEYKIPKIIYSDAYSSEMIAYADLILPDTTYLERWDCISLLDRPISGTDAPADAIRQPVVEPDRDVRPFQTVLLDLGARLGLPGFVTDTGSPRYPGGYPDYIVNHERSPGIGSLAGFRGADGKSYGRGAPNPKQLESYIAGGCFHEHHLAPEQRYYKHANKAYLDWAKDVGFIGAARRSSSSFISSRCRNSARRRAATARSRHRRRTARGSKNTSIRFRSGIRRSMALRAKVKPSRPSRNGRCTSITRGARTTAGSGRSRRKIPFI
jgi:anaerobic selenocysteine-containing dehydrogenase